MAQRKLCPKCGVTYIRMEDTPENKVYIHKEPDRHNSNAEHYGPGDRCIVRKTGKR